MGAGENPARHWPIIEKESSMSIKRAVNHPVVVVLLGAIVAIPFAIGFVAGLVIVPMAAGYLCTWPFIDKLRSDRKKECSCGQRL